MKILFINLISLLIPVKKYRREVRMFLRRITMINKSDLVSGTIACIEAPTTQDITKHIFSKIKSKKPFVTVNSFNKIESNLSMNKYKFIISDSDVYARYKNQIILEVWHASGFIKTCRINEHKIKKYVLCPSKNLIEDYSKIWSVPSEYILPYGSIKNDYLFNRGLCSEKIENFYNKFPNLKDKKKYVYTPTFRGDYKEGPYTYVNLDIDILEKELKSDEVLLIKLHPNLIYRNDTPKTNLIPSKKHKKIFNVTDEDLMELTLVSDCFISDYSSTIFDAMVADKPVLFYAEDIDTYDRGFAFDYRDKVPNLLEKSDAVEFLSRVRESISSKNYKSQKYIDFKEKFLSACDGKTLQRIEKFINEKF